MCVLRVLFLICLLLLCCFAWWQVVESSGGEHKPPKLTCLDLHPSSNSDQVFNFSILNFPFPKMGLKLATRHGCKDFIYLFLFLY